MSERIPLLRQIAANAARGFLMGGADVVPGVSGGTVALILGIYLRLVTAVSRFDLTLLGLLRRRGWRQAARHVDLGFLVSLAGGIALGILSLGGLMNHLITDPDTRSMTLAAFLGMILASSVLVARMIPVRSKTDGVSAALFWLSGAAFAFWFTGLPTAAAEPNFLYIFACGMLAICAMILPGISGAYVLLVLGAYVHLTNILKRLPRLEVNIVDLATVAVFGSGCAIGLLAFSKILRWLLAQRYAQTMALLCGFMCGSLRKIWPFQTQIEEHVFENYCPRTLNGHVVACLAIAVLAMVFVFAVDRIGSSDRSARED